VRLAVTVVSSRMIAARYVQSMSPCAAMHVGLFVNFRLLNVNFVNALSVSLTVSFY